MTLEAYEATKIRGVTVVHPIAAIALIITGILMLTLPRKKAFVPFFIMTILVPYYQCIAVATLDFYLVRILIIIGLIRVYIRSEIHYGNKIDKTFALMLLTTSIISFILWQSAHSVITSCALFLDMLGSYILLKSLILDLEDIDRIIKIFIFLSIITAAFMINEQITQRNLFSLIGGVPEFTALREGRLRSQGSFAHPILAGTFGALMLPMFVYLWKGTKTNRSLIIAGVLSTAIIVYTSASSGPIVSYLSALLSLLLYAFRWRIRTILCCLVFLVITLHLYMKAPVWAIIGRFAVIGGSTAYYRFFLFDAFIKRFSEWWLLGTKSTEHWNLSLETWDVTNQYVHIGMTGGLITLIIFIVLIALCFKSLGRGIRGFKQSYSKQFLLWTLGSVLFTHLVTFMGVAYFGQIFLIWVLTITMISNMKDWTDNTNPVIIHH